MTVWFTIPYHMDEVATFVLLVCQYTIPVGRWGHFLLFTAEYIAIRANHVLESCPPQLVALYTTSRAFSKQFFFSSKKREENYINLYIQCDICTDKQENIQ